MPTSKPKPSPLEKSASPTKSELDEKSLPDSPKSPNFTVQAEKAKRSPSPPPDPRSLKAFFARFNMGRGNVLDQVHTKETSEKEGSGDEMLDALLADDFDDDWEVLHTFEIGRDDTTWAMAQQKTAIFCYMLQNQILRQAYPLNQNLHIGILDILWRKLEQNTINGYLHAMDWHSHRYSLLWY